MENSGSSCCLQLHNALSFKTCFFFATIFLFLMFIAIGMAILLVIFFLRPQVPGFFLQTIRVDSYKLIAYSNSTLLVSSSISLILNAQNHNKVGIKYSSSRLHLYHGGIPIGLIQVPAFYQPAHSENVNVTTKIYLPCLNVTHIFNDVLSQGKARRSNIVELKILGDFTLRLLLSHLTLPRIKVALECEIDFDYMKLAFKNEHFAMKAVPDHIAHAPFPVNPESFSKKCTLSLYL